MNKVVAVVLNYNTAKDSKKCLEYLLKQDYADFEIVVVDNNSPMNDYQKLESDIDTLQSNRIELIRNGRFSRIFRFFLGGIAVTQQRIDFAALYLFQQRVQAFFIDAAAVFLGVVRIQFQEIVQRILRQRFAI